MQAASKKTPYQGKSRCYGLFKCPKCNKEWESANSWANMGQKCRKCDTMVYPYQQRKLKKKKDGQVEKDKQHDVARCEKCQSLGHSCTEADNAYLETQDA